MPSTLIENVAPPALIIARWLVAANINPSMRTTGRWT